MEIKGYHTLLISLLLIAPSDALLAFQRAKVGSRIGIEPALDTCFITSFESTSTDLRNLPRWSYHRWNGRLELFYKIHRNINTGIFFKTVRIISEIDGKTTAFTLGMIGISSEYYTPPWRNLAILAGFSMGSWVHLSKKEWVVQNYRISSEIRAGLWYIFSNKWSSQVYVSRDFIYYEWAGGFSDTYTWWHMWSIGLSITFHPFR